MNENFKWVQSLFFFAIFFLCGLERKEIEKICPLSAFMVSKNADFGDIFFCRLIASILWTETR
jgi:hypothetical protein